MASVILALVMIVSTTVSVVSASPISEETRATAVDIANQIESEGIVLLKNEDNTLPLETRKVNVFGAASCSIAFAVGQKYCCKRQFTISLCALKKRSFIFGEHLPFSKHVTHYDTFNF